MCWVKGRPAAGRKTRRGRGSAGLEVGTRSATPTAQCADLKVGATVHQRGLNAARPPEFLNFRGHNIWSYSVFIGEIHGRFKTAVVLGTIDHAVILSIYSRVAVPDEQKLGSRLRGKRAAWEGSGDVVWQL